jgi:hypothetical protein
MCVIIHKPAGVEFSPEDVAGAFNANSHGFGVMYLDKESGEVIAKKKLLKDLPAIQKIFADLKDEDAVFHFRIKTHGPTNDMFCHPFQVLNKKQHGRDMWLMHNGIIGKAKNSPNESDTYAYVRDVLTDKLRRDIDLVEDEWFQTMVEYDIGHSKLVFLDDKGRITKYNENYGDEYKGCWVSNKGFVASKPWIAPGYRVGSEHRHGGEHGNEYGVDFRRRYASKGETSNVTNLDSVCQLRGVSIKPGSKIHIFAVQDPHFYAMGTITAVERNYFHASYTDPKHGVIRNTLFYGTGMTGDSSVYRLQCIPECFGYDQSTKVFSETKSWPAGQDVQTVLRLEDKTTKEEDTDMTQINEETPKKETGNEVTTAEAVEQETQDDDDEVQPGVAVVHEGNPTIEYCGTKPVELIVDYKDCRWGGWGGGIDAFTLYGGSLDEGTPEITLLDIHNMEPQDRIDWFFRYPASAFGIFQDLIEQTVADDDEVIHAGDEVVEESVEASREAKAITA